MAKKIKRRKGAADAKQTAVNYDVAAAEDKKNKCRAELRKRGITPEYCQALIDEFDRMLAETI